MQDSGQPVLFSGDVTALCMTAGSLCCLSAMLLLQCREILGSV